MATVTIGCKLPHGLIADHKGVRVQLAGANSSRLVGGFGITSVDKDFADGWIAANKNFVDSGVIFVVSSEGQAEGAAKERKKQKSGLEPIDPEQPGKDLKKAAQD